MWAQQIAEIPLQIKNLESKLENEFSPIRVWKDLDLGPAQQEALMERLLDVWYPLDQAEAILGAKSQKQSVAATKSQEAKSYPAKIRDEARTKAQVLWGKDPAITIADMAYKHLTDVALMKNGSVYSDITIRKWIKDLCPDRNPGRRPMK